MALGVARSTDMGAGAVDTRRPSMEAGVSALRTDDDRSCALIIDRW